MGFLRRRNRQATDQLNADSVIPEQAKSKRKTLFPSLKKRRSKDAASAAVPELVTTTTEEREKAQAPLPDVALAASESSNSIEGNAVLLAPAPQDSGEPQLVHDEDEATTAETTKGHHDQGRKISEIATNRRRKKINQPTARESAYSGPPRYDWIDIVSSSMQPTLNPR